MQPFFEFAIGSLLALFPVVGPCGGCAYFLVLTTDASQSVRRRLAQRTALYVLLVLLLFLLIGGGILRFFGISLEVVRISGGIVVFHAAWQTMNSQPKLTPRDNAAAVHCVDQHEDISLIPMTIPMLAGPGSIAVTLGLAAQAGRDFSGETFSNLAAAAAAIALVSLTVYLSLSSSTLLLKLLGDRGISAMSRILGLFIMAIGVQLILNGLADWLELVGLR
ncbi:MAG: MarC family protein [Leptolyngbyaceae cyanobacterium SM1_1_3]|nr:MarC family protein [Leptolyngbyaceae cyanobacterium SM1_1_3]